MDRSPPGSSVLGIFFQQEYWAAMPSPGDFPGIEPTSPALQVDDLPLSHQESPGNNSTCPKHSKFKITRQISAKFENSTFMLRVENHTTYLLTLIKINSGKQTTKAWNKSVFLKVWASLVAQLVKNPPAMQETWVQFLGWEDPLEKGTATHSTILAWRIPWTVQSVHGVAKSWTRLSNFHFASLLKVLSLDQQYQQHFARNASSRA